MKVISDWEYFGLKGKVKTVRIYKYRTYKLKDSTVRGEIMLSSNGIIERKGDMQDFLVFNKQGQLVESRRYPMEDSTNYNKTIYTYHESGELEEEIHSRSKETREYDYKNVNVFDSNGRKLEKQEIHYNAGTPIMRLVHTYDSAGFIIRTDAILRKYGLQHFYTYVYDTNGDLAEQRVYEKDSTFSFTNKYPLKPRKEICGKDPERAGFYANEKYDKNGNWVELYCDMLGYIKIREITYYE